jgi:hypothetical protein
MSRVMTVQHIFGDVVIHSIEYLVMGVSHGYVNLHSTTSQITLLVLRIPTFPCGLIMSNYRHVAIDGSCSWLT